jgi:DNA-binding transcriptional LysR family regulator
MDARQLQFFAAVVREGSFSEAARACHVTQPAISVAVRKLEAELGVPLLERRARRLELTPYGHSLYRSALDVAADLKQARASIEALRSPSQGQVRLGVDQTIAPELLVAVTGELLAAYPGIRVQVTTGLASQFASAVEEGELDFIIAQEPLAEDRNPEQDYTAIYREAVFPVARPGHPLAGRRRINGTDFRDAAWCALRWIRGRLLWMPEFFAVLGEPAPMPAITGNALALIKEMLRSGDLLGLFPEQLVAADLAAGRLVRIGGRAHQVTASRCVIQRRRRFQSPAAAAFLERLRARTA